MFTVSAAWQYDGDDYTIYPENYNIVVPSVDAIIADNPTFPYYNIRQIGTRIDLTLTDEKWVVSANGDTTYYVGAGNARLYQCTWNPDTNEVGEWSFVRSFTFQENGWNSGPTELPFLYVNFDIYDRDGNFFKHYLSSYPTDGKIIISWNGDISQTTDDITDVWYKVADYIDADNAVAVYDNLLYSNFYVEADGDWAIENDATGQDLVVTSSLNGIYAVRNSDYLYVSTILVTPAAPEDVYYRVTLPSSPNGYVVTIADGSSRDVIEGGSFSFSVTILDGYIASEAFSVTANGVALTPVNGVYTISNILADQVISVSGVVEDSSSGGDDTGGGDDDTNSSCNCIEVLRELINKQTSDLLSGINQGVLDLVLNLSERFSIITDAISAQTSDLSTKLDLNNSSLLSRIDSAADRIIIAISNSGGGSNSDIISAISNQTNSIVTAIDNISIATGESAEELKTNVQPIIDEFKDMYKPSDDDTTINISAEDIFGLKHIVKLITDLIDTGSDIGDLGSIVSNEHSYRWFTAEIAADLNTVGTTTADDNESTYDRLNREFNEIYFPERVGESA